jgi:diphthamide synthase (EF-2-diphthine--ammonia ligase)
LLDASWLGRSLRRGMLADFARLGVDPCGERGEYHTLVTNSPLFRAPLHVKANGHVPRSDCWSLDVVLDHSHPAPLEPAHAHGL